MPRLFLPDGTVKYYESQEELEESLVVPQAAEAPAAEPKAAEKPKPPVTTEPSIRSAPPEEEKSPGWVEETIRTIATAIQQAPDKIVAGLQAQSQSMPTSMLTGGDPMLAMMARSGGLDVEKITERVDVEAAEARRGARAAAYGITVPNEKGEFQKFGIPEEVPVVGPLLSGEGKIKQAIQPKTKIGQDIADVGSAMVMTMMTPGGPSSAAINMATIRAAAKPTLKTSLRMGLELAKRVGADLPQDFVEELLIFGLPEPTQEQKDAIDNIIEQTDPKVRSAMIEMLLADDNDTYNFYNQWLTNTMANTAASAVIRGHLGALNQTRRYAQATKRVKAEKGLKAQIEFKELEKVTAPIVQRTQEIVETDRNNLLNQLQLEELAELNRDFNSTVRGNMEALNTRADGLITADLALRQAAEQGTAAATEGIEQSRRITAETARLGRLIKDRTASIKELEKLDRKNPGYLSGTVKRRYNRYQKQLDSYKQEFEKISGPADDTYQQRASRSIAQFESLSSARLSGIDSFVDELDVWVEKIDNINARRLTLDPELDLTKDPYYQTFRRIKADYENYKALGGKDKASGSDIDAGLEMSRLALEERLLGTIKREFGELYEFYGGQGPVPVNEEFIDAGKRVADGEPVEQVIQSVKKTPEAPKAEAKAPGAAPTPATEEPKVDPWTMSKQTPLKTTEDGQVVANPNASVQIGVTEGIPQNKQARLREVQINLDLRNPQQVEDVVTDVQRFTTDQAVDDYIKYVNDLDTAEKNSTMAISDEWQREATKSLVRTMGEYDSHAARKLALLEALKRKTGQPVSYVAKARERSYRLMGKYANAESDWMEYQQLLADVSLKRGKAISGIEDAHVMVEATAMELSANSERVLRAVSAMADQADSLEPGELQTYRAVAAQEALILLASLEDFLLLRNRSGSLLAQFRGSALQQVQRTFGTLVEKKRQGKEIEGYVENYIKDIQELQKKLAEEISDQLPDFVGLPSNMKVIQETLNKFTDPDLVPNDDDVIIFNKIISQMAVAASHPQSLGQLAVTADQIVQRQILSGGISNIKTQTSFPVQSAIYGGSYWLSMFTGGKIVGLANAMPWWKLDELNQFALQQERLSKVMLQQINPKMAGFLIKNFYMSRLFNRSVITDAISPIDNAGKFTPQQNVRNPVREIQALNILNNADGISDRGISGALKRLFGEESAKKIRNNINLAWVQFHDQFFLGDAYKVLEQAPLVSMGRYSKARYDFSPAGAVDRFVYPNIPGVNKIVTPYESKLVGGEVLGGSLPLRASEIGLESVGGTSAMIMARAKAQIDIEDMVDGNGRPLYVKGTKAFEEAVDQRWHDQYLSPIKVGMGAKTQDIAYAVADEDAQYFALAQDMMLPMEDDAYNFMYERLKSRGDDGSINFFLTHLMPYVKTPLTAHKHHFYYSQPFLGSPVPTGVAIEGAIAATRSVQRLVKAHPDSDQLATRILGFQSKLFSKDPKVRHQAITGLSLSSALNVGIISLVESNALEITGGQRYQYQEANGAYIPMYSVKIGGFWVPYRWLPYVGETLAYAANLRDARRHLSEAELGQAVGTLIMTTASTLFDTPALAGMDTLVSILEKPSEAEYFILDYLERTGGVRFPGLRQGLLRAVNESYGARPVLSGEAAGVITVKEPISDPREYSEDLQYHEQWQLGFMRDLGSFFAKGGALLSDRLGLRPAFESLDKFTHEAMIEDQNIEGDYRQAHWYKPGDIMYSGPGQASFMGTMFGRHWPVPDASNVVDTELFRHGIKPPSQAFQSRYGIVANDVMINRFRRFMGTEYRTETGKTVYEAFDDLVSNRVDINGGTTGPFYKDLPDDPRNSLTLDAKTPPQVDVEGLFTKRAALMELRRELVQDAADIYLRGAYEVEDNSGNMNIQPIKYAAPESAREAALKAQKMKSIDKLR